MTTNMTGYINTLKDMNMTESQIISVIANDTDFDIDFDSILQEQIGMSEEEFNHLLLSDCSTTGNPYAEYEIESEIIEVEILDNLEIAYIETI